MAIQRPHLIVIAGPNGAGKSTTAPSYCDQGHGVVVNNSAIWHNIEETYGGKGKT